NAREPTTATLACDQRRCRHSLARVKVIDLNFCVFAKRPGTRGFWCERRRERLRGARRGYRGGGNRDQRCEVRVVNSIRVAEGSSAHAEAQAPGQSDATASEPAMTTRSDPAAILARSRSLRTCPWP